MRRWRWDGDRKISLCRIFFDFWGLLANLSSICELFEHFARFSLSFISILLTVLAILFSFVLLLLLLLFFILICPFWCYRLFAHWLRSSHLVFPEHRHAVIILTPWWRACDFVGAKHERSVLVVIFLILPSITSRFIIDLRCSICVCTGH